MPYSFVYVGLIGFTIGSLISSCATIKPSTIQPEQSWESRIAKLESYTSISAKARTTTISGDKSTQFSLDWQQTGDTFSGAGYSFIGSQLFAIHGDQEITYLQDGNTTQQLASKDIIKQFTGLSLKPLQLFQLIAAMPIEDATQSWKDGMLASQVIEDIEVHYLWWNHYASINMPRRLKILNPTHKLTLSFTAWEFD